MNRKLALVFGLLAVLLPLLGCARAAGQASVAVSCDEFTKEPAITRELEVPAGSSFTLTLCSNPSTGFQWEEPEVTGDAVELVDHEFVAPSTDKVGAPGQEVWTFKALNKGRSTVSLAYSRPWEGGEKGEWKFELAVVVK